MFRQIITPKDTTLLLQIPKEYVGQEVEVIAFPVNESQIAINAELADKEAEAFYRFINIDMSKFKFDREKAYER